MFLTFLRPGCTHRIKPSCIETVSLGSMSRLLPGAAVHAD